MDHYGETLSVPLIGLINPAALRATAQAPASSTSSGRGRLAAKNIVETRGRSINQRLDCKAFILFLFLEPMKLGPPNS